jgi:hypothetical protein
MPMNPTKWHIIFMGNTVEVLLCVLSWCYSPVLVLAASVVLPCRFLSSAFFPPPILVHQGFWDLSLYYPRLSFPALLLPSGLETLLSYMEISRLLALVRCPSHLSLPSSAVFTRGIIQSIQQIRTRTCSADRAQRFSATTEPFPASESAVARWFRHVSFCTCTHL